VVSWPGMRHALTRLAPRSSITKSGMEKLSSDERKSSGERQKGAIAASRAIRFASLILVVVTIAALGAVAFFTERGIVASRDWVIHTYQVRAQLNDLQLQLMRLEEQYKPSRPNQAGSRPLQSQQAAEKARQTFAALRTLTGDNLSQQIYLNQLWPLMNGMIAASGAKAGTGPTADITPVSSLSSGDQPEDQINKIIESMQDEEQVLLGQRLKAWEHLSRRNALMLGMAFAVVTLLLVYNFWLLIAEVARTKDREEQVRANAQSYRLMSARILELQDSERRRIARELHDSVGQFLVGLKINLSQLENGSRVNSAELLRETIDLTDYALQEVRTISHLLHPPLLEELGFLSAARWYVDEYGKRSQVQVSVRFEESIGRLPREIEIALFRVLQESLTNVYRHAAARSVDISIARRDGLVVLTVADNGKGIPHEVLSRFDSGAAPGIGLAGMRERLAEFGGRMNVHSSSAGSVVEVTIPY
jgi:signal transduction histidine kinase